MTRLSRLIITAGIILFTLSAIAWIITTNWQWFAAGASVFFGTILAGGILSVEPKDNKTRPSQYSPPPNNTPPSKPRQTYDWERPKEPPPTKETLPSDPFDA